MFLSEIYSIQDKWYVDALTSDKGYWVNENSSNLTYSFNSDGMKVQGLGASTDTKLHLDIEYPTEFSVEFVIGEITNSIYTAKMQCDGIATESTSSPRTYYMILGSGNTFETRMYQVNDKIKFVVENNTVNLYVNDVLKKTNTVNSTYTGFEIWTYQTRSIRIKDLVIEAL